ncbi:MAG: insulinase family protein [Silicimonas sp.]|nr:insulinase family protein [Silicimonas sp.]
MAVFAAVPHAVHASGVTSFELDNGMQVVVVENHRAPVVMHMVWYKVGAADEPPGQSGIAHFLEHLMFKATDELAAGELSTTVNRNGGSDNAFTAADYTGYFQRIASDRLELVMSMEASRMDGLRLVPEDIGTERDVVIEERNQRIENEPGALFNEQMRAAQYLNHPYAIPIIGWRHEAHSLTLEDANAFYKAHYGPNNAILVVAGDTDPDEVRALAEKHYGVIPPNPAIAPRDRVEEPPQLAERRLDYSDPRIGNDYVIRTYLAPERDPGAQQEAAALTLLAEVLGGSSTTSVLARKLQFEKQASVYSSAWYSGQSLDDTTFGLINVPVPGTSLDDAEAALDQAIGEFIEEGVDSEELARIKTQIRASEIYALDDIQGLANRYGAGLTSGLTIEDIESWSDILQAVTEDDIIAAAQKIFDRRKAVTGFVRKSEEVTQ